MMKPNMTTCITAGLVLLTVPINCILAGPVGTAFTYQGSLNAGTNRANGTYDFRLSLCDCLNGGSLTAGPLTNSAVAVSNGLFAITLDFGAGALDGSARWLELAVRTSGGGAFTVLSPRQGVTPTPYAILAGNVAGPLGGSQLSGTYSLPLSFNNPANSFTGVGNGLTGVNADTLGGLAAARFWQLGGNAGTAPGMSFLGTTDNQALELRVNGLRSFRLEPNSSGAPNVIGGAAVNLASAGVLGAVIAGGGAQMYSGSAFNNQVASDFGTIGGGLGNTIQSNSAGASICGGYFNWAGGTNSAISGGRSNRVAGLGASVGGGVDNSIGCYYPFPNFADYGSTIAGGAGNRISSGGPGYFNGPYGLNTIGGGGGNTIWQSFSPALGSTICGGISNSIWMANAWAVHHTIGGGFGNSMGCPNSSSANCTIGGGCNNTIAGGLSYGNCTIGGGYGNEVGTSTTYFYGSNIGGGEYNFVDGDALVIAGGSQNEIYSTGLGNICSAIGGGGRNVIDRSDYATVSGGLSNSVNGDYAIIPGGQGNAATTNCFAAGHRAKASRQGAFVWADSTDIDYDPYNAPAPGGNTNSFNVRATGGIFLVTAVNGSSGAPTSGMYLSAGGSGWNTYSDRNAKTNFVAVDTREILDRLATIPVLSWNYKTQDASVRHIGPMAQDFNASFDVGEKDKTGEAKFINSLDADGLALAAIQGLNQKLEEKNSSLEKQVAELTALVKNLAAKVNGGEQ